MTGDNKKLLILDGISGVPLGQDFADALQQHGVETIYADLKQFAPRQFYYARNIYKKLVNKRTNADSFYHFPKLCEEKFADYLKTTQPDAILVIGFMYKFLSPQFWQTIQAKLGFKLYLYDTDSCNLYSKRREFIFFIENELPIYTHIFSSSQVTARFFKHTRNLPASFFSFGANIIHIPKVEPNTDVLFVGSSDLRRIFLLEHISQYVKVFGLRWSRNLPLISKSLQISIQDKELWGDALYHEMAKAKIVLNITRTPFYGAETGVNLRVFEALAAGCFLLTDYCDELADLFVIGKEIDVFRSANELREKVEFYLANPKMRLKIAHQGQKKFLEQYTWQKRAQDFLQYINYM